MQNKTLTIWDLDGSSVYIKIKSPYREELFKHLIDNHGGFRGLAKRVNLTFDFIFKQKKGRYFASLKQIKRFLDLIPEDKRSYFRNTIENNVEAIKLQSSSNSITEPILPIKHSPVLFRIAGHLVGDGGIRNDNIVHYTNINQSLLNEFRNDIIVTFGDVRPGEFKHAGREYVKTVWFPGIIGFLIKSYFGKNGKNFKSMPNLIPDSDDESKANFLRALFDDEGCVSIAGKTISLKMLNKGFVDSIKTLLNDFEIATGKTSKCFTIGEKNPRFRFYISNKINLEKFYRLIGFNHPEKEQKLKTLLFSYKRK